MKYSESIFETCRRRTTREVKVGSIGIGGDNPIRIQSMTTSKTSDVEATIAEIEQLVDAGCELVRVTVQGKREAMACERIKSGLTAKGLDVPLVADIHFYPPAALVVADFVDKVRINPGNYLDRRAVFKSIEYTDSQYADEVLRIEDNVAPLIEKCKARNIALRIGTNHGSLSDRILSRFGDTPFGMVESALEYARACRKLDYHNFLFSMKASNTLIMVQAYRLLVEKMNELGWDYPLHLGVTEAGAGIDGRCKSAIGLGTLLVDGIGDTIRVSLTEDPVHEIPACRVIRDLAHTWQKETRSAFVETKRGNTSLETRGTKQPKVFGLTGDEPLEPHWSVLREGDPIEGADVVIVEMGSPHFVREVFERLDDVYIILRISFTGLTQEEVALKVGALCGPAFIDGIAHGICIEGDLPDETRTQIGFSLLQGCRLRMTKTEFIACPSCGRTLFNLQDVTKRIEAKTKHLPGVKIAIMGCIVNGPGEMADADFGYVGSRTGMIDLYVGKECVERNIPEDEADERLIDLIKSHGMWVEPSKEVLCQ